MKLETSMDEVVRAGHATQVAMEQSLDEKRNSAIKGAVFSEFIDMFDIYLPVIILAPIQSYFLPKHVSGGHQAILESLVFITTLLGRPLGAILFGRIADRVGRRTASILSVTGFGVATLLIALIPGYASSGIASYWLLVLLRFVDGIFLGGGYTGALPLAIEYSRKEQRGLVGGLILAGFPAAYVAINVIAMAMFALFPLGGPDSPYAMWGWRLPFVIGAAMAGLLAVYYVRKVSESEVWAGKSARQPEATSATRLVSGQQFRNLMQVLLMMTGFWLTQNVVGLFLPTGILLKTLHLSAFEMTVTLMIAYTVLCFAYVGAGIVGQWIGRRTMLAAIGVLSSTIGAILLGALIEAQGASLVHIGLLVCALAITVSSAWAVIVTYINERFATGVRATGFGVGYSLSVIIPSFYAFYMNWLGALVPSRYAPVALLVIGGIVACVGALMGPETKNAEL
ncbi:MFS transporter [Burkholderia multivorans]|uniref:MFS transporter n=2 Tax=Burkholderia multivorans TaxID=87883 RepID=A0AAP2HKF8_9BURK|nr:MFS transporter [Burkholderia multivorans]MBU9362133.1 MFS transporter [Burkholderia multivorans]MBU9593960.1 MFS transporter [Burkholderia multivorans]